MVFIKVIMNVFVRAIVRHRRPWPDSCTEGGDGGMVCHRREVSSFMGITYQTFITSFPSCSTIPKNEALRINWPLRGTSALHLNESTWIID